MSSRLFLRLGAELDQRDIEAATDHPAVTCVSVDRGQMGLCRPCVELDPEVEAMLARSALEHVRRSAELEKIAREFKPS